MAEETVAQYRGVIIIEWPAAVKPGPYNCMSGAMVTITDAVSGKMITTCSQADITVHVDAGRLVTADLTLFTDEDGEPLLDGEPVAKDGEILTATFPFLVGEMKVRQRVLVPRPGEAVCFAPAIDGQIGGGPCRPAVVAAIGEGNDDIFADLHTPKGEPLGEHVIRDERGPGYWGENESFAYRGGTWHLAPTCRARQS